MNITLSIDEKVVAEASEAAAAMGKTLNEVIREDLEGSHAGTAARSAMSPLPKKISGVDARGR